MTTKLELLLEAERRGILPPGKKALLDEARARGLVGETEKAQAKDGSRLAAMEKAGLLPFMKGAAGLLSSPTFSPEAGMSTDPEVLGRRADDLVRSIAQGATFNYADELAAMANESIGQGDYATNVAAERARDAAIPQSVAIPGQLAGGVMTGSGLARTGMMPLSGARPTLGSLAGRGGLEGMGYSAAYGSGAAQEGERLGGAAKGALIGGATGALTGALARPMTRRQTPSLEKVKEQSQSAYRKAEQAGVEIPGEKFTDAVADIFETLRTEGFDRNLHPKVSAVIRRFYADARKPQSIQNLDMLRRVASSAARSSDASERRLASMVVDKLDDYMSGLTVSDVSAGDPAKASAALREARSLWSKFRKGEMIQDAIERAWVRAGQFTGSGYENALRTEMRSIAMNPKRMRQFTNTEQRLIRRAARGGPLGGIARLLGKFSLRGPVSGAPGMAAGAITGNPAVAAGVFGVGEGGRAVATEATRSRIADVLEQVLTGKLSRLTPAQDNLLRSIIIGEQVVTE